MATRYSNGTSKFKMLQCVRFPAKVNSNGFITFGNQHERDPFTYSLPTLELQIVTIFLLTHLFHYPLKKCGIQKLVAEIGAGIILGSTLLGKKLEYHQFFFPASSQGILGAFSAFGYLLFQFLSGVKMDPGMIRKTGPKALAIGITNLVVPLVCGAVTLPLLPDFHVEPTNPIAKKMKANRRAVLMAHSMTAFPVVALLLKDLKILNSELGRLALSSGLISHLLQVVITSVNSIYSGIYEGHNMIYDLILSVVLVLIVIFAIRPGFEWIVKQTPEGRPVEDMYIYLVILLALLSGIFSHWVDIGVLVGPFIVGLAVPEGPPLGAALVDKLEGFSSGVLLPTFVTLVTLRANLADIASSHLELASVILVMVTFSTKIAATTFAAMNYKMPLNDALALGLILSTKGVVDLANYSFSRDYGFIDPPVFSLLVLATAVVGAFVPLLIQLLYDPSRKYAGYQNRNVMHSRLGGKLPLLACIHTSDNIFATMRLLDAFTPSTENPIVVHVLHLIELCGRASPIFISHRAQTKADNHPSYSEDVIVAFKQYERSNWGAASALAFTAISPRKLMHEDICTLALDELDSMIIIPFHRRWGIDGSLESDDASLRALNRNVLDRAPCSVGILIDRAHLGRSHSVVASSDKANSTRVAVIFLGGRDDQEAVTLAKRMTKNGNINLTIVRCLPKGADDANLSDDDMLDIKVLYDFKQNRIGHGNVTYSEKFVSDPSEMAWLVRSMADEYDLILVGRRYKVESPLTLGFDEWCDVPELGILGDILATSDLRRKASVLVVQQQQIAL